MPRNGASDRRPARGEVNRDNKEPARGSVCRRFYARTPEMTERSKDELRIDPQDRLIRSERSATQSAKKASPRKEPTIRATKDSRRKSPPPPAYRTGGKKTKSGGSGRGGKRRGTLSGRWWQWGLLALAWLVIIGGGAGAYFWFTLPPISDLAISERRSSVTLLGTDNSLIATFGDLFGEAVHLKDLPPYLPEAVIATEDHRFYYHFGIDPIGLARAFYVNIRAGHVVQGGSTITQQLAKNLFLTPERTMTRKIQEALLAIWLEHRFTKDQILEIYLNRVYFGAASYGVDAAAHRYFDKSARNVTLYEAATIAGLLKAPTRFSPARDRDVAATRTHQVLANMANEGYITPAQEEGAQKQEAQLAVAQRAKPGNRYFADWIYEQIPEYVGLGDRDLIVVTTLDPKMQAAAESAVNTTLTQDGDKYVIEQGAMIAMSPDGAIRAMVGGRDYGDSQFNRATQALRQPGSAFKPIVYAAALERGLNANDHFSDAPIRIGDWQPRNFENEYRGDVTAAQAVAYSINTVAAQVLQRAGIDNVIAMAHRLGITADLERDASIALGTSNVSLLDLTTAYAAFASGGIGAWPYGVVEVRDNQGHVVYHRSGSGPGRVIPATVAGTMDDMMTGVIDYGTGKAAKLDRPAAGKTGTTQDSRDALFVGFTADLVTGVWVGNDDNSPMKRVTGGMIPARIWRNFMMAATHGMPVRPLPSGNGEPLLATQAQPQLAAAGSAGSNSGPDRSGLDRLLHSIFGGGNDKPAPVEQRPAFSPPPFPTRYR